ncbi:MAG: diaminopimelate decarboxylase [Gammaproteobacteria bacterium]|nr:diaminopimelate decarboxylase [Gammaproteobacteria bacterium]
MTDVFAYADNVLHAESVSLDKIAEQHGSPTYVYSRAAIEAQWRAFDSAFTDHEHLVCYAVKANSNLAVLNILARLGSGFDIVSVGELERVLAAGGDASRVVFSGVGKRPDEITRALEVGIRCFNVESEAELERINEVAGQVDKIAPISLRVNPDIDAGTHPYISTGLKENKFGIPIEKAADVYAHAAELEHLEIHGIDCHIGSQLTELSPFSEALTRTLKLVDTLADNGIHLQHIDIGGGIGIRYATETPPTPADYARTIMDVLGDRSQTIIIEPGRAIVGNAGVLLTRIEFLKHGDEHNFAIVDAAMNDLMRPALYSAWQAIDAVAPRPAPMSQMYDIVGPVCETGDFLGKQRLLALQQGDLLAVRSSGAYGFSMSSNYNSRPRAAEVMVDGDKVHVIRERESLADLVKGEHLLPE